MNAERILVDTSAWVEYFRGGNQALFALMDKGMDEGRICIPDVVLAEMIQGAKTEAEGKAIDDLADAFTIIGQKPETWLDAGRLSRALRKKGKTIHLVDCYIASQARENKCAILTLDEHFADIGSVIDIELIRIHSR